MMAQGIKILNDAGTAQQLSDLLAARDSII